LASAQAHLPERAFVSLQRKMEEAMLDAPPQLVPGAGPLIADLHASGIRLGIISDTGLTIGRVMRQILSREGLLRYFDGFSFSDELGVTKPHPLAFHNVLRQMRVAPHQAVHVGDLLQTDVRGAKGVGMRAVLITGITGCHDSEGEADAVVDDFAQLRFLFTSWGLLETKDPAFN